MGYIQITSPGIRKALKKYGYEQAISEYIWNGFDAKASQVELRIDANQIGTISKICVIDNGYGIDFDKIKAKFEPFFESEKEIDPDAPRTTSAIHGKNGVGRLTFFSFANFATWESVYEKGTKRFKYTIEVTSEKLNSYFNSEPVETEEPTGTKVTFLGIQEITLHNFDTDIRYHLMKEFGWFLELNSAKKYRLTINDTELDYSSIIDDVDSFTYENLGISFTVRYVQWKENINKEFSRYYLIDSTNTERYKYTTTLNYKGDHFFHSLFITSPFFDSFHPNGNSSGADEEVQPSLFSDSQSNKIYKALMNEVNHFLRNKRKPFLKAYTDVLIAEYEKEGVFPRTNGNMWDKYRQDELQQVVRELYQVEPKIFAKLNIEQKKTFIHFLDLIIDSGERDKLLEIIESVVDLDVTERHELARLLKVTKLSNIIKTIKLIEDRFQAIAELKELVYNRELGSNENDVQRFIEKHYWIFGEQYHLVTAAEPKFEEALRRHIYLLRGEKKHVQIEHADKNKEMDIFMVRQDMQNDVINNVVVELKHPRVKLGSEQMEQVKTYMGVITNEPLFNAPNMTWQFHLVGNAFDSSGYIARELKNAKHHGENSLVFSVDNYKIYIKKWSEIFTDFELRHQFLYKKLELERESLIAADLDKAEIAESSNLNSARQEPEIKIPN